MNSWSSFFQLTASIPALRRRRGPSPFAKTPIELVRTILEEAARSSRHTAYTLALVSRTVRSWAEPILYAAVSVRTPSPCAFLAKDPAFLAAHVRALSLIPAYPTEKLAGFPDPARLAALPNLRALHLAAAHLPYLRAPELALAPAELTVRGAVGYAAFHWEMQLLATVERLAFWDDCPRHLLGEVCALSHFACAWTPPAAVARDPLPLLRTVLALPRVRVVVVRVGGARRTARELERLAAEMRMEDKRVVFVSGYDAGEGEEFDWAWAEAALRKGVRFVDASSLAQMRL